MKLHVVPDEIVERFVEGRGYGAILALARIPKPPSLAECLETLTERSRRALDLFYREGAGRTRIAEALDLTVDGVKTLMRRARETLRACIGRRLAP